tara:strand:+ start:8221 stop:9222 length:1002 start_codon:yes stop_codon:yes gene_type:complete
MSKVAIVGVTTWGITLGLLAGRSTTDQVSILTRTKSETSDLVAENECSRFLPGIKFPENFLITHDPQIAINNTEVVILAVPSHSFRHNLVRIKDVLPSGSILVSATKGLEMPGRFRMTEIVAQEVSSDVSQNMCVISGPNLAKEIVMGKPSSSVIASHNPYNSGFVRDILMQSTFRIYTSEDVIGVELCGTLKNIIAIGAGIVDGLGLGDNAKAAYLTRGIAEITRLGAKLGAYPSTFAGLAGVGDIVATSFSELSRNRYVGEQIALGKNVDQIISSMQNVVEGIDTTKAALELGSDAGVELPITETISKILFHGMSPDQGITELMSRRPTSE